MSQEEKYFKEQDARRLAEKKAQLDLAAKDEERKSHFMRCPKCGGHLETLGHEGVEIDRCKDCKGIWLDAGELESLVESKDGKGFSVFGFLKR